MDDVQEGWVGRPKGMQQILWEQGLLDPTVIYIAKSKQMMMLRLKTRYSTVMSLQIVLTLQMN